VGRAVTTLADAATQDNFLSFFVCFFFKKKIQDATASRKTTVGMEEPPLVFQTRENQRKEKGPEAEKKQSLPRADRLTHGPPSAGVRPSCRPPPCKRLQVRPADPPSSPLGAQIQSMLPDLTRAPLHSPGSKKQAAVPMRASVCAIPSPVRASLSALPSLVRAANQTRCARA
jgi:hypothetical protein